MTGPPTTHLSPARLPLSLSLPVPHTDRGTHTHTCCRENNAANHPGNLISENAVMKVTR